MRVVIYVHVRLLLAK